ncbi:MAG: hypothetical protein V6Z78_00095 [Holosporaceae bacterium]
MLQKNFLVTSVMLGLWFLAPHINMATDASMLSETLQEENFQTLTAEPPKDADTLPSPLTSLPEDTQQMFKSSYALLTETFTDLPTEKQQFLRDFTQKLTQVIVRHCMLRDIRPLSARLFDWSDEEKDFLESFGGPKAFCDELEKETKRTTESFDESLKNFLENNSEKIKEKLLENS